MIGTIRRSIEMENGNTVHFTTGPVYPFWTISFDKGGIPKELSGQYTEYKDAVARVEHYLKKRPTRNRTILIAEASTESEG